MNKLILGFIFLILAVSVNAQTAPIKKKSYVDEQKILNVEASTPRAGYISAPYRKTDGNWYEKTDAGVEQLIIDTIAKIATKYDIPTINEFVNVNSNDSIQIILRGDTTSFNDTNTQSNTPITEVDNGDGTFTYSRTDEAGVTETWTTGSSSLWTQDGDAIYNEDRVVVGAVKSAYTTSALNVAGLTGIRFMYTDNITTLGRIVPRNTTDGNNFLVEGGNNVGFVFQSLGNSDNLGFRFRNKVGTDVMVAGQDGKVGIGIVAPTQELHVVGDARITGGIYDSNNGIGTSAQILSSTGTGTDWIDNISLTGTGTTNRMPLFLDATTVTSSTISEVEGKTIKSISNDEATLQLYRSDVSVSAGDTIGMIEFFTNDLDGGTTPRSSGYIKNKATDLGRRSTLALGVTSTINANAIDALMLNDDGQILFPTYDGSSFLGGSYSNVLAVDNTTKKVGQFPMSALTNHTYSSATNTGVTLSLVGTVLGSDLNIDGLTNDPSPSTSTTYATIQTGAFSPKKITIDALFTKGMDSYNDSLEIVEAASAQAAQTASTSTVGEEFWFRITGETGLTKMRKE